MSRILSVIRSLKPVLVFPHTFSWQKPQVQKPTIEACKTTLDYLAKTHGVVYAEVMNGLHKSRSEPKLHATMRISNKTQVQHGQHQYAHVFMEGDKYKGHEVRNKVWKNERPVYVPLEMARNLGGGMGEKTGEKNVGRKAVRM